MSTSANPIVKLSNTPVFINVQGRPPPPIPVPANQLTTSAALHAHQRSHKRFTLDWAVFEEYLTRKHSFDPAAGDEVIYAQASNGYGAKEVKDTKGLDDAFRQMRSDRGGVGFWLVKGGWRDWTPIPREEYLAETFFDGEDDQELSESEDERVIKWAKGLVKAEPPISNTTTYK